jgi:hypothetical protein
MTTFTTEDRERALTGTYIVRNKCPCDVCEHFNDCKKNEWACRSFAKFVIDNAYFADAPRVPSRGTFNKIFNQKDDNVLKSFVRSKQGEKIEDQSEGNTGE